MAPWPLKPHRTVMAPYTCPCCYGNTGAMSSIPARFPFKEGWNMPFTSSQGKRRQGLTSGTAVVAKSSWPSATLPPQQVSKQLPVFFINKVLLRHSHICPFVYCLWLLPDTTAEWIVAIETGLKSLKYFYPKIFLPFKKMYTDPCSAGVWVKRLPPLGHG